MNEHLLSTSLGARDTPHIFLLISQIPSRKLSGKGGEKEGEREKDEHGDDKEDGEVEGEEGKKD